MFDSGFSDSLFTGTPGQDFSSPYSLYGTDISGFGLSSGTPGQDFSSSFSLGGNSPTGFGIPSSGFSLGAGGFTPLSPGLGGGLSPQTLNMNPDPSMISRLAALLSGENRDPNATPGNPQQGGNSALNTGAGLLTATGALGGLAGVFQQLSRGRPATTVTNTRGPASPQEQQLLAATLQQLSQMQGLAHNAELQQAVSRLASGQLPISSDLVDQVTKAFSSVAANTSENAIQGARERGFAGGSELLGGAGSPQFSRSMAQVQSDVSQALVNLALGLPQTASNINAQQMGAMNQGINSQVGLLSQLGAQAPQIQNIQGPRPSLLDAMGPFSSSMQGLGQGMAGFAMANRPQQQGIDPATLRAIFGASGAPSNQLGN